MRQQKWLSAGLRAAFLAFGVGCLIFCLRGEFSHQDRLAAADALVQFLLTSSECAGERNFYGQGNTREITLFTPRDWPRGELNSLAGRKVYTDDDETRQTMLGISIGRFKLGAKRSKESFELLRDPQISVVIFNAGEPAPVIGRCFLSLEAIKGLNGWNVKLLESFDP